MRPRTPAIRTSAATPRPASVAPRTGSATPRASAATKKEAKKSDRQSDVTAEEWLEKELAQIEGLPRVKEQMRSFLKNIRLEKRRRDFGLPATEEAFDMVFYGNPGTGKTSLARLLPEMLCKIGILKAGAPFLEVGRGDLVGAVIGK